MSQPSVIVVGAGLAGLSCAHYLYKAGLSPLVLEAADEVGGRVRTDRVDGFLLDRGFQVLQTAYPEAQVILDYESLDLHRFEPGAIVRTKTGWAPMMDPWRCPSRALNTILNPVGTLADRWRLAKLRWSVTSKVNRKRNDISTIEFLRSECHFSTDFIDRFLRPWISGMFFDEALETSAEFFRFVFRMLAVGDAALPGEGMGAIARQLADGLPLHSIRCSTPVTAARATEVHCENGESLTARAIVLAVDGPAAQRLISAEMELPKFGSTTCFYFAAPESTNKKWLDLVGKALVLNGQQEGPISNLSLPSRVAPNYAPSGSALVCVSIRPSQTGQAELETHVRNQLAGWFGSQVSEWRMLQRYDIPRAIPRQLPGSFSRVLPSRLTDGRYVCGDYRRSASIQGALESGRLAAEAVVKDLS